VRFYHSCKFLITAQLAKVIINTSDAAIGLAQVVNLTGIAIEGEEKWGRVFFTLHR
jgi:uncharacterized membrane protein